MKQQGELFYRLDRKDTIVDVGGAWDRFANENDGQSLTAERIRGQSLFAHIVGTATREFVWTLLDAARKLQQPVTRCYRCDSPTLKRYMEMTIEPDPRGLLLVRHRLLSTEPLQRPIVFKVAASGTARRALIVRCSSCNRVRAEGAWLEPEAALSKGQVPTDQGVARVAYGVCSDCTNVASEPPSEWRVAQER